MKNNMDDILQHYGVKGMRWGVKRAGNAVKTGAKKVSERVKEQRESTKREKGWADKVRGVDLSKTSTAEINRLSNRIKNENDFKQLSRNREIATGADRKAYRTRANLSDKELSDKVENLRAKHVLKRNVSEATSEHRRRGKQLVALAIPLAMQVADNKVNIGNLARNMKNPDPLTKAFRNVAESNIDKKYGRYDKTYKKTKK